MTEKLMRRVVGYHDIRMDGIHDLVLRAKGAAVFDIGCNRGLVGFEMANNGARLVHGCDNYAEGIDVARHLFKDIRNCESRFECIDLTQGSSAIATFNGIQYDITLMLATYHKLKRVMKPAVLTDLMQCFARRTTTYFGWRATSDKPDENEDEMIRIDKDLEPMRFERIHTSYISEQLGVAAIWRKR